MMHAQRKPIFRRYAFLIYRTAQGEVEKAAIKVGGFKFDQEYGIGGTLLFTTVSYFAQRINRKDDFFLSNDTDFACIRFYFSLKGLISENFVELL